MPRYRRPSDKVFIYNISKKLVNTRGNSRVVNFKYAPSSDGYAYFVVDEKNVSDSANPNLCNVILPKDKNYRLNYKDGKELTAVEMSAADIKKTFELTRTSNSKTNQVETDSRQMLDELFEPNDSSNDNEWDDPFGTF